MKIGQVLSTVEIAGPPRGGREEFSAALARCATTSRRSASKKSRSCIEAELGAPIETAFAEFEPEAFAAASIGQVHRATTHDGERGRRQGPVSGRRRGGRGRPAESPPDPAAGQADGAGARRQGGRRRAARADRRRSSTTSSKRGTTAPSSAPSAATRSRVVPARPHRAVGPPRARHRATWRGPASTPSRRWTRRPGIATARSSSASSSTAERTADDPRRPPPRQLPAARRREGRLPRFRHGPPDPTRAFRARASIGPGDRQRRRTDRLRGTFVSSVT